MAAIFSRVPAGTARVAVQEARTAASVAHERLVFLLVMPLVLAAIHGWGLSGEGEWFTRPQSVIYWASGTLPLWWLNTAVGAAGARLASLSRGIGLWLWIAAVPVLTFIAAGLAGFFDWRWQFFASWFLGSVPQRQYPASGSAAWWLWMAKGSVVPIIVWTSANLLQRQLFGRTLLEPRPAATWSPVPVPLAPARDAAPAAALAVPPDVARDVAPDVAPAGAPAVALDGTPASVPAVAVSPTSPDFLRRLDRPLAGPLLAVQAQEHYIRIVGEGSAPILLYRFSDALEQLRALPGLQVHRSWWVALDAVAGIERDNGRLSLRLVNGERVPVSRRYVGAVEIALRSRAAAGERRITA